MKVLVIPDVHLKPWMFDGAEKVDAEKYDKIICLGDLVDDWNQQYNTDLYEETLQRVLKFDEDHNDMFWCLGNHDFSYLWGHPESGFSSMQISLVAKYLMKLEEQAGKRLGIVHDIDGILFSHAGLRDSYVNYYFKNSLESREQLLKAINYAWKDRNHEEKLWKDDSPIWARPLRGVSTISIPFLYGQSEEEFENNVITQVVGHTPVEEPIVSNGALITDTFSTYSDGKTPIGDARFVLFDTESRKWEYA